MTTKTAKFKRGQIYIANIPVDGTTGSEQTGIRPVVILQNDVGNKYSPNLICSPLTSKVSKKPQITHVSLDSTKYTGLDKNSKVLCEHIKTIGKDRIDCLSPLDMVDSEDMKRIENGLLMALGISR